jgi:GH43 family beta-xylosidase
MQTFRNPVSPFAAPDPFMTYDPVTGYYYALFTRDTKLELFRSRHAGSIVTDGDSRIIYTPNGERDGIWGNIWAPEMHRGSNGKWYIYTSGRIKPEPSQKRLFIMEGPSEDPFEGEWIFRGMPSPDIFSIDPTVYTAPDGVQYLCSSRVDPTYGQVLDICDLVNPYTYGKHFATIARAELEWELVAPYVGDYAIVEGAFFLERNGRLFIIYSANGCYSDHYCLGVLEHTGGSLCDAANWKKHEKPLLVYGNGLYGPGHASFFASPDGSEVWCAYHGMKEHAENATSTPRYFNLQRVEFDSAGYPVMGLPIGYEVDMVAPSGEEMLY